MDVKDLVRLTAEETARQTVNRLRRAGMLKENRLGSYKKTERALYEFAKWVDVEHVTPKTRAFCSQIQHALNTISGDPYYQIIELKYFEHWTHERIAEYFDVDVSVISKRVKKLINQLRPIIFSDDFIRELYEE